MECKELTKQLPKTPNEDDLADCALNNIKSKMLTTLTSKFYEKLFETNVEDAHKALYAVLCHMHDCLFPILPLTE